MRGRTTTTGIGAQLGLTDTVTTTSGIVTLTPAELSGSPRLVRIPRGDGTSLNLERRQPSGTFDDFGAARGTFTYTVRAFDAAGNVGLASNAVSVSV